MSAVNNELQCYIHGAMSADWALPTGPILKKIIGAGIGLERWDFPSHMESLMGQTARNMPRTYVETNGETRGPTQQAYHTYRHVPEYSEIMKAWAGHHLHLSAQSGVPLRRLMAEHMTLDPRDKSGANSSLEVRLAILKSLRELAVADWLPAGALYDAADIPESTARNHLGSLTTLGIIDRKNGNRKKGGHGYDYRVARDPLNKMLPRDLIGIYVCVAESFARGDNDIVESGLDRMEQYMDRSPHVGTLINRSLETARGYRAGK